MDKNGELTVKARQLQRGKKWREDEDKADGEDCDNDGEFSAFRTKLFISRALIWSFIKHRSKTIISSKFICFFIVFIDGCSHRGSQG